MPPIAAGRQARPNQTVTVALMGAIALAAYNNLAVTAALPDIGDDLGRVALLGWVVTVELLAGAIAVLAVGPLIDSAGARHAFRLTIVATAISSGLCAVAPTMITLIAARVLQGLGTGALLATVLTCIGLMYDSAIRPRIYALFSTVWGAMGIGGPALAAILVSNFGWRAVFSVNIPVALLAALVGWNSLPAEPPLASTEPFDRKGLLLVSAVTIALLLTTADVQLWNLGLLLLGGLLAYVYWRHARGHRAPVVRVSHIIGARWWPIHATAALSVGGGTGSSVFLALYLHGARGYSIGAAAFAILWPTLGWAIASWVSSHLQTYLRAQSVVLIGTAALSVGTVSTTLLAYYETPVVWLLAGFVCLGGGIGIVATASLSILQRRAETKEMGRVSSAHQFLRSLGFAYGPAIAALVLFTVVRNKIGDTEQVRHSTEVVIDPEAADALAVGFTWSLAAMTIICILAVPTALVLARRYTPNTDAGDYPAPSA